MVTGTEPSCGDAPRSGGAAALFERLAAVEAGIHEDRYRQPAAVLEEIARLWTAGATISGVAARTDLSREIVRDRLRRAGALEPPLRNRNRHRHRHAREELERRGPELIAAYEAGAPITALAAEAGVCRTTLSNFLVAHGVRLRHDRGWYRRWNPGGAATVGEGDRDGDGAADAVLAERVSLR
jgi:hypothetical protein